MTNSDAKVAEAYQLMRNPEKCSLAVRLECHALILNHYQPLDKSRAIAMALADVCIAVQMLLGEKAE